MIQWFKTALALALVAAVFLAISGRAIADSELGKRKAIQACAACHGVQGMSTAPRTPHLAGQDPDYLGEQLQHYRSGKRLHEVMSVIAKSLSDKEIEAVSLWYGSNRIVLERAQ
ncbi:MAG: cytochrome c [Betaproteobacteria bacterium]|nr:cytochrome c [Betaproteobacteria bacterium]NBO44285.1 cytochrome c [Betaproteobacteria bacterium]NBP10275.1 cytochrome c [Betaproteobacteria bacterium]NBP60943.1 cytochrome c [Betaproteobacteria bacterium]NBQ07892.1 cytochrome c [Betaproteobacteria bacterium]